MLHSYSVFPSLIKQTLTNNSNALKNVTQNYVSLTRGVCNYF